MSALLLRRDCSLAGPQKQGKLGLTSPDGQNIIKNFAHRNPLIPRNRLSILVVQIDSVHQLAVDVELLMKGGTVTNTDRGGVAIT